MGHIQQRQKNDHADAVVEQAFARDLDAQAFADAAFLENAEHCDRIGRRDKRAEQQSIDIRKRKTEQVGGAPYEAGRDEGRDRHPHGRQHGDNQPKAPQFAEINMQRPGEQQERQHAVQHKTGEIDPAQKTAGFREIDQAQPVEPAARRTK